MSQTDRLVGLVGGLAIKAPCRAVGTANVVLSAEQTVGGVALITGDRVLLIGQTDATANGIYVVDTGSWSRAPDFDGAYDVISGTLVPVFTGALYSQYVLSNVGTITIGTAALTFLTLQQANAPGFTTTVDSIAALKALTVPANPSTVIVRGFAAAGDGGGGIYYWNSTSVVADDGGTTIALNSGGVGRFIKLF